MIIIIGNVHIPYTCVSRIECSTTKGLTEKNNLPTRGEETRAEKNMILFAIRVVRLLCALQFKYIRFYIVIIYDNIILSVFLPPVGLYTGTYRYARARSMQSPPSKMC